MIRPKVSPVTTRTGNQASGKVGNPVFVDHQVIGCKQDQGQFGKIGGLEVGKAQINPAPGLAALDAQTGNKDYNQKDEIKSKAGVRKRRQFQ